MVVKEYSLSDFVELCNECKEDISEPSKGTDNAAKKLGSLLASGKYTNDDDNNRFLKSLKRRMNPEEGYKFLQNIAIETKVSPFKPFVKMEQESDNRILSQRWHVLISLLAFFDTASFDDEAGISDTYKIGEIEKIVVNYDERSISIKGKKKTKTYGKRQSKGMRTWIFDYVLKDKVFEQSKIQ